MHDQGNPHTPSRLTSDFCYITTYLRTPLRHYSISRSRVQPLRVCSKAGAHSSTGGASKTHCVVLQHFFPGWGQTAPTPLPTQPHSKRPNDRRQTRRALLSLLLLLLLLHRVLLLLLFLRFLLFLLPLLLVRPLRLTSPPLRDTAEKPHRTSQPFSQASQTQFSHARKT